MMNFSLCFIKDDVINIKAPCIPYLSIKLRLMVTFMFLPLCP